MAKRDIMKLNTLFSVKYDEDAIWEFIAQEDEHGNILQDEDGFTIGEYVLAGSYPMSPFEEMIMQLVY